MRPNFGAGWAGSGHTLSTLRPGSRLPGRKTRFRVLARLYRVGSMTHWVPPKGFELFPTSRLLSQASPGASALRSDRPRSQTSIAHPAPDRHAEARSGKRTRDPAWLFDEEVYFLTRKAGPLSYSDLQKLVTDAQGKLEALKPDEVNALEGKDVAFQFGETKIPFTAETFVLSFSLPNFHFHATTAYDILRSRGVPVGKRDYMGRLRIKR